MSAGTDLTNHTRRQQFPAGKNQPWTFCKLPFLLHILASQTRTSVLLRRVVLGHSVVWCVCLFVVFVYLLHLFVCVLLSSGRKGCPWPLILFLIILAYCNSRFFLLTFDVNMCCSRRVVPVPGHSAEARADWTAASVHSNEHSNVGYLKLHLKTSQWDFNIMMHIFKCNKFSL